MKPLNFIQTLKKDDSRYLKLIKSFCAYFFIVTFIAIVLFLEVPKIKALLLLRNQYLTLDKYITNQSKIIQRKKALSEKHKKLKQEYKIFNTGELKYLLIIEDISNIIPHDVCLDNLEYSLKNKIIIKGQAKKWRSLSKFIKLLGESKKFQKISVLNTKKAVDQSLIDYEINLKVV